MATTYDKASLVMIPSGYKDDKLYAVKPTDGSGDFTFSRDGAGASPATRVNASGIIEKGRTNDILYSNDFTNVAWEKVGVTLTTGQADPFGGNNATKADFAAGGNNYLAQGFLGSTNVRTRSIWMRADSNIEVSFSDGVTANPINITTSWVRYEAFKVNSSNSGIQIDNYFSLTTPQQAISVYVYAAQVEDGLVATDYIETTTAPVSAGLLGDMPRLDYSGGATCPSLLLEPSRVNLFNYSEASSEWVVTRARNEIGFTSPEGVANATKVIPNTDNDNHYTRLTDSVSQTFVNGTTYTISFYVKAAEYSTFVLSFVGITADTAEVDLSDESHNVGELENAGNGWYRFYYTFTADNTSAQIRFFPNTNNDFVGNDSDGILIYGAQLESSASYPTSYIPTYGSASTRGADDCNNTSASAIIGQTEGTLYVEVDFEDNDSDGMFMTISDGTSANRLHIGYDYTSDWIYCNVKAANLQQALLTSASPTDGLKKIAVAYKQNDFVMYINGTQVSADSNANVPTTNRIDIGGYFSAGFEHPVKQNLLFKTRLTNAELAALTA